MSTVRDIDKMRFVRELEAAGGRMQFEAARKIFKGADIESLVNSYKEDGYIKLTEFNGAKYIELNE